VRFARLIHRPVRVFGGPAVRAAFGGDPSLTWFATQSGSAQRLTAADLLSGLRVNVCRWEAATTHASHCGACLTFVFAAASAHVDRYARG
jgi:hypothetical protein